MPVGGSLTDCPRAKVQELDQLAGCGMDGRDLGSGTLELQREMLLEQSVLRLRIPPLPAPCHAFVFPSALTCLVCLGKYGLTADIIRRIPHY